MPALPWLRNKQVQQPGLSVEYRKPDENAQLDEDDASRDHGLEACAEDLIRGIELKDKKHVLAAIKSIFEILDSMPHDEGEHTNEE
jgi:hypothetical protein